jgi:hypothetical protein
VADTTYIVLRRGVTDGSWQEAGRTIASSAESAIRLVATGTSGPESTTYVAIPARSFKPLTVRTETTTIIRLDTPQEES